MLSANAPVASHTANGTALTTEALTETVVSIVAEVTRYPIDILQPDSNLEEDLGIDSVKRTEIIAVLRARLNLPEPDAGAAAMPPPRTIADVVNAVQTFLKGVTPAVAPPPVAPPVHTNGTSTPAPVAPPPTVRPTPTREKDASLEQSVINIIAEVTRYPKELLKPEADIEEDLGFHVGQQGAVFAALRSRLRLVVPEGAPLPAVKTIADVIATVQRLLPTSNPTETRPAPTAPTATPERQSYFATAKPFTGKVVLVTGAGHGLGKAIAVHLANLGASVAVNSFHSRQRGEDTTAEIVAAGGKAVHLWGSVTNQGHLEQIFSEIDNRFGGLDFFVSNASNGILAPVKDIEPEHWDRAFRTNVVGLHQASMLAARSMRKRGGGKIVALSSIGAQRCLDYLACIGTVKAAVESLVRYLAVELGGDNIQVNAVSAGPVYGELMEKYPDLEKLRPRCEALTPRKRLNDEQEVAEAVTFLLSNSGMSGTVLLLDAAGGQRIVASSS